MRTAIHIRTSGVLNLDLHAPWGGKSLTLCASAVATAGQEGLAPNNDCFPPLSVYSEYVFGTSRNDKTTENSG